MAVKPYLRPLRGLRLLVVDPDEDAREMLQFLLAVNGADSSDAGSIREALTLVKERKPDALLCEAKLGDGGAVALLKQARGLQPTISAICLATSISPTDEVEMGGAGFVACLVKPVWPSELIDKLAKLTPRRPGA